jgi:hypothetical protein
MSADSEKIPPEVFQLHCLATHLKGDAAVVLDRLTQEAARSGPPFASLLAGQLASCYPENRAWLEDEWYRLEVPLDKCYIAHEDFRHRRVPKDKRFVDFLDTQLKEIESGSFPCSFEIRTPWRGKMLEPLVKDRGTEIEKYYVLDGQLRVIWHWYHHKPNVKVFIYRGKLPI